MWSFFGKSYFDFFDICKIQPNPKKSYDFLDKNGLSEQCVKMVFFTTPTNWPSSNSYWLESRIVKVLKKIGFRGTAFGGWSSIERLRDFGFNVSAHNIWNLISGGSPLHLQRDLQKNLNNKKTNFFFFFSEYLFLFCQ